jgi:hypothetical protein
LALTSDDAKRNNNIPYAKQQMKVILTGIWKAEDMLDEPLPAGHRL